MEYLVELLHKLCSFGKHFFIICFKETSPIFSGFLEQFLLGLNVFRNYFWESKKKASEDITDRTNKISEKTPKGISEGTPGGVLKGIPERFTKLLEHVIQERISERTLKAVS